MRRQLDAKRRTLLGANIRARRKDLGLTQQQLAEAVDIEPQYLQRVEYGKVSPSLAVLVDLVGALRTGADALLGTTRPTR